MVRVVDQAGEERMVCTKGYLGAGVHDVELDLGAVPSGAYTLLIETPHGVSAGSIVVLRD